MDQTLKEIYLPYKKKLDKLAEPLAKTLSIDIEEALTLIEDQIKYSQDKWIQEEKDNKEFNEMMEEEGVNENYGNINKLTKAQIDLIIFALEREIDLERMGEEEIIEFAKKENGVDPDYIINLQEILNLFQVEAV